MKKRFMLLASFIVVATALWADVEISEANFPDANFRNWLLNQSFGADGVLTDAEIAEVKEINVLNNSNKSIHIHSLKGIEHFTSLTELECSRNELTSLDVSQNVALEQLKCQGNLLTSLDVSQNKNLISLYCDENRQMTSLNVSECTELTVLDCEGNKISSLDVSKCTKLTKFYCQVNQLVSLDVSQNTALIELECQENQLTSLDVSKNTALEGLVCYDNPLKSLDVSNNTELKSLQCGSNQLTSLNVTNNTKLTKLECEDNQLVSLDLSKNTELTRLYCYKNKIKGEAMDNLVAGLPTVSNKRMRVIYVKDEQNVMTTTQVEVAKSKGWNPQYCSEITEYGQEKWQDYGGSAPTGINVVENTKNNNTTIYDLNGVRQPEAKKGINIVNGKKVVLK